MIKPFQIGSPKTFDHENRRPPTSSARTLKTTALQLIVTALSMSPAIVRADSLCVPFSRLSFRSITAVDPGESCPRGTRRVGSFLSAEETEKLVAGALRSVPAEPLRFSLAPQTSSPPLCLGMDVKSRCADEDGCVLRYRITVPERGIDDPTRVVSNQIRMIFNPETHQVTIRNDGVEYSGMLGSGVHSKIITLAGGEIYIATDKPEEACVDSTNFVDDGPNSIWLQISNRFQMDGALLD
jgi:hypothetical protein